MDLKFDIDARAVLEAARASPKTTIAEMRRGLLEACRVIQTDSRAKHRFRSQAGMLERSVDYHVLPGTLEGVIEIDPAVAPYGHWVHTGTRPHDIFPRNKQALRWTADNSFRFAKRVHHPGTQPDEFLYEAAERGRAEVNAIFSRHTDEALRKAGLK